MRRLRRRVSRSLHRGGAAVCHRPGALPALRAVPGDVLLRCDRPPFVTELDEPTRSSWLRRNARFGRNMPPMPIWPSEFVSSEPQGFPPSGLMEAITQSPRRKRARNLSWGAICAQTPKRRSWEREPGSDQLRVAADALPLGTADSAGKASASGDSALPRATASAGARQSLRATRTARPPSPCARLSARRRGSAARRRRRPCSRRRPRRARGSARGSRRAPRFA